MPFGRRGGTSRSTGGSGTDAPGGVASGGAQQAAREAAWSSSGAGGPHTHGTKSVESWWVAVRTHPGALLVVPLLVLAVGIAVGLTGVKLSANTEVEVSRSNAREAATQAATAMAEKLVALARPVGALQATISAGIADYHVIGSAFNKLAGQLLVQANISHIRGTQLHLMPQGVRDMSFPPPLRPVSEDVNVFNLPSLVGAALQVLQMPEGKVTVLGPALTELNFTAVLATAAVFVNNVTANETFNQPVPALANCPRGLCWNATTGRKFWGLVAAAMPIEALIGRGSALELLAEKGYHYVLVQRNAPALLSNTSRTNYTVVARSGDMYDNAEAVRVSVNDSVTISGLSPWMLYVCPEGGWQSSWREPVYITVVVAGSVLVAVLLHLLMYSRLQHKLLLYRLMPRTLVHKLKAHASMPVDGKPRNRQGAGDVFEGGTTPAEVMLQVLANCLEGHLPDAAVAVQLRAALLSMRNIYQPVDFDQQLKHAHLDDDVASALMRQLQQQDAFSALSHFGAAALAQPYQRLALQSHAGGPLEGATGEQEDQALELMLPLGQVGDGTGDVALEEVLTRLMMSRETPAGLLLTFGTNAGAGVGAAGVALSLAQSDGIPSGLALQPHGQGAGSRRESHTGIAPPSYRGSSRGNLVSMATPPANSAPSAAAPGAPVPSSHPLGATNGAVPASFSIHTAKQSVPTPASESETESLVGTCVTPSSAPYTADAHPSSSPALQGAGQGTLPQGGSPFQAEGPASSLQHPSSGGALLMLPLPPATGPGSLSAGVPSPATAPGQAVTSKQGRRRASARESGAPGTVEASPPQQAAQAQAQAQAQAACVASGTHLQMAELLHQAAGGGSVVGVGAGGRSAHSMMAGHVSGAESCGSGVLSLGERGVVSMRHSRSGIGVGRLQVGSMRRGSGRTPTTAPSPCLPLYDEVHVTLERAYTSWTFDAFALDAATNGHPLSTLMYFLTHRTGLIKQLAIPASKLARFCHHLEQLYTDMPYHNRVHASDVMQTMHVLMTQGGLVGSGYMGSDLLGPVRHLACLLAAAAHDVDHAGLTNDFLINTSNPLAVRYNDKSPLEMHHLATTFTLLHRQGCDFVKAWPRESRELLRKTVIELVLATDMKQHFAITSQFKAVHNVEVKPGELPGTASNGTEPPRTHESLTAPALLPRSSGGVEAATSAGSGVSGNGGLARGLARAPRDETERLLAFQMALKVADLGALAESREINRRWVDVLEEEFFMQGDKEREAGLAISPLFDRTKPGTSKSQSGFFQFVGLPLFGMYTQVFPEALPLLELALENFRFWKQELERNGGKDGSSSNAA